MTDKKTTRSAQDITSAAYKTQQTIMQSASAAQERNAQYTQGVFEQGVDVLKSHVEATRSLMQQVETSAQEPQKALQASLEGALAAQKRNASFVQYVVEHGIETLKDHVEDARGLTQELVEQAQEQRETFLELPYMKAYRDLFATPLASYKQAVETTRTISEQMIQFAQKSVQQSLEFGQKATEQVMENTLAAMQPKR